MMERKYILVMAFMIFMLATLLTYIIFDQYNENIENTLITGAETGYSQALGEMFRLAITCQQIPLTVGNQTIRIIAVECLQVEE